MNSLTALIYFAGVSDNIQGVLMAMAIISGIIATGCLIAAAAFTIGRMSYPDDPVSRDPDLQPYPLWVRALIWVVPVVLVWGILWWLVIKPVLQFTEVM